MDMGRRCAVPFQQLKGEEFTASLHTPVPVPVLRHSLFTYWEHTVHTLCCFCCLGRNKDLLFKSAKYF